MVLWRRLACLKRAHSLVCRRYSQPAAACQDTQKPVQEVVIPVPWGHIAGKWWGPTDVRPILCVHGWQDNAGTWDTLAPMLPADASLLAFDLPGHGWSSFYPPGHPYYQIDYLALVRRIVKYYGWDSVSLLGHSMGSIVSFMYSCTYPDEVSSCIALDALEPVAIPSKRQVEEQGKTIDKIIEILSLDSKNSPLYTYEEAVSIYEKGTVNSATTESCKILLKRGMEKQENGKYSFSRDRRLKYGVIPTWPLENILQFAGCIKCSVLIIRADKGYRYNDESSHLRTVDILRESAKYLETHVVEGTHHVHLNNPEKLAPLIVSFLQKCFM